MPNTPRPLRAASRMLLAASLALPASGSVAPLAAQTASPPAKKDLFTWADAALMGGFAIGTVAISPLDRRVAERLQQPNVQENRFLGSVASVVRETATPGSGIIGVSLYVIGRLTKEQRVADLGLHGTEALVLGVLAGTTLKGLVGRARPFVDIENPNNYGLGRGWKEEQYRSFPSGHTIAAFSAAAAVTSEVQRNYDAGTAWVVGALMYGGAGLAGVSRIYNNKHWASDVMMGAAIGTFAGLKVVRFHHGVRPEGTKYDRWLLGTSISTAPDGQRVAKLFVAPKRGW